MGTAAGHDQGGDVVAIQPDAPPAGMRTYTINEVAAIVGKASKAVRRQVERGTLVPMPEVEVRDGRALKVISEDEVRRVFPGVVIPPPGEPLEPPAAPDTRVDRGTPRRGTQARAGAPAGRVEVAADGLARLGQQIERLADSLATHRLLEAQAGERARAEQAAREAAQAELVEARARESAARAREAAAMEAKLAAEQRAAAAERELATARAASASAPERPSAEGEPERKGWLARFLSG